MAHTRLVCALLLSMFSCAADARPNVLFIIVDDLRADLPVYGEEIVHAPNIDRLASDGIAFANAYANVPVCGASRASLMSGLRPTRTRFFNYYSRLDEDAPGVTPMHALFKAHGYHTESIGKVFHNRDDSKDGWSVSPWLAQDETPKQRATGFRDYQSPENITAFRAHETGPSTEAIDVPDNAYFDGQTAERAMGALDRLATREEPFFLAVGFVKPHLPFTAPKKYWDLYAHDEIEAARVPVMPEGIPAQARHTFGELRSYSDVPNDPNEPVGDELAHRLKHGYYASISYADAQVGRVLDRLQDLGLDESTIVILIGDHGWSLGEHGLWAKHSPFDVATRTVAIARVPGIEETGVARGLIEFVDIYPTLMELAGIAPPAHLQGESFVPLLADTSAPGKRAVYPRWKNADIVKTERYALTTWTDEKGRTIAEMMFDHDRDRDETVNIVGDTNYGLPRRELRMLHSKVGGPEE